MYQFLTVKINDYDEVLYGKRIVYFKDDMTRSRMLDAIEDLIFEVIDDYGMNDGYDIEDSDYDVEWQEMTKEEAWNYMEGNDCFMVRG
jgi:hypothetical protein